MKTSSLLSGTKYKYNLNAECLKKNWGEGLEHLWVICSRNFWHITSNEWLYKSPDDTEYQKGKIIIINKWKTTGDLPK